MRIKKFDSWKDKDSLALLSFIALSILIAVAIGNWPRPDESSLSNYTGAIKEHQCYQRKSGPSKLSALGFEDGKTFYFANAYGPQMLSCAQRERNAFQGRTGHLRVDPSTNDVYALTIDGEIYFGYQDRLNSISGTQQYFWFLAVIFVLLYFLKYDFK